MSTKAATQKSATDQPATGLTHRSLPLLLLQAREAVMLRFRPVLNRHGITEQQWRVVRALLEHGELEPREIVQVCAISSPSLAGMLARMDEQGLVQRSRKDADLRRVAVTLTPRSRKLAAAMAPELEAVYGQLEGELGTAPYARLLTQLDQLRERLG